MVRIVAKLAFIFVILYAGTTLLYSTLEKRLATVGPQAKIAIPGQKIRKTTIAKKPNDYSIIVTRNIFQAIIKTEDKQPEKVEVQETQDLEPTSLDLTLLGTAAGDERTGRAIIADKKNKKQDIYQVGDAVQDAIIKSIERGRVVLRLNGRDEVLVIKDRNGSSSATTGQAPIPPPPVKKRPVIKKELPNKAPVVRPRKRAGLQHKKEIEENERQEREEALLEETDEGEELEPRPLPERKKTRVKTDRPEEEESSDTDEQEYPVEDEPVI